MPLRRRDVKAIKPLATRAQLRREAKFASACMQRILDAVNSDGAELRFSLQDARIRDVRANLESAMTSLRDTLDIGAAKRWGAYQDPELEIRSLRNSVTHLKRKSSRLENEVKRASGPRVAGRICAQWFIRAGLADPRTPVRPLVQYLRDFPMQETKAISHTYVTRVQYAFVELVNVLFSHFSRSDCCFDLDT